MAFKRTTRSGKGGTRTTYTQSFKGPKKSSKISTSSGSKYSRITTTTNLNTGERKSYLTQRSADGWVSRKSLSPPKQTAAKPKKTKKVRTRKSKPIKFSTILIILCTLYLFGVISNL
jgi:cobalamin biosynthesis Mg chelatase CobN